MGETLQLSLTEWSILEEHGCLGAVPPRLFVLECLGCMKSLLFLLKAAVAHRRIKSSKQGMAYERIAITSFQNIFWGEKSHKVRSLPPSTVFWPKTAQIWPTGIITLCGMSVPSPGTMPHQSDSCPQCCRRSWALCVEEETSKLKDSLFSIAPTAGVYRGFRGC